MGQFDYISLGFCSNDHLAVLPFIPMDTKVKMVAHRNDQVMRDGLGHHGRAVAVPSSRISTDSIGFMSRTRRSP